MNDNPVLVGMLGIGIQGSRSPEIHQLEADAQGLRLIYRLFDLKAMNLTLDDDLGRLVDAAELLQFAGLNVTHPLKKKVISHVSELTRTAKLVGAVNTIVFSEGRRIGDNTDLTGFIEGFRRGLGEVSVNTVVQVGAGGVGGATATAMMMLGANQVKLYDIDQQRASDLAKRLSANFGTGRVEVINDVKEALSNADGLINATPVGMSGKPRMPIAPNVLHARLWVADVIYFPLETELLRTAREVGCKTVNGSGMVVLQAAAGFKSFTGLEADKERMLINFARSSETLDQH